MRDTATMVNGFDMSSVDALDPELRQIVKRRASLLGPALDLASGYHAVTPLTAAELGLLPDLILGRIVARIIISEWRAERFPGNRAYVLRNTPGAWRHLDRLLSIGAGQFAARIQEAARA